MAEIRDPNAQAIQGHPPPLVGRLSVGVPCIAWSNEPLPVLGGTVSPVGRIVGPSSTRCAAEWRHDGHQREGGT